MTKEVDKLSFEEALVELEKIVRQLEGGSTDLKTSIDSYARGITLKKHCEDRLRDAQGRIDKISVSKDGTITTAPFSLSE